MPDSIRIASYNVKVAGDDAPDEWDSRVNAVAGTIRHLQPDLVGLQEPTSEQLDDLQERLPTYKWIGVGRDDGNRGGEFSPIGVYGNRFAVTETQNIWLSETPNKPGSIGWDATFPRILTQICLSDRTTGMSILHANTHLSHVGEQARCESAQLIRKRLDSRAGSGPVILTGDLNCEPASPPYEHLLGDGDHLSLTDAMNCAEHSHHGPKHTFTGFTDPRDGRRIDYVFVSSDCTVEHHATCTDLRTNSRIPSDHLPVVADISVE